ncbi:MAG TPA: LuxR C-terminal-related transcriptional regulator, partial [Candidatus Eremiobacteraceae bacterium]|nr:LuxR C-terminal-related transcriptional regulator [Candidatus Eremiobacteraceae bacterium]
MTDETRADVSAVAHSDTSLAGERLTQRELDVLALMAHGLTNKEISQRLEIGRRTVETHIHHLLDKLGATTRTRAVVEAGRLGLLAGSAPTPLTPSWPPNNLPIQLTALIGRADELAAVEALLDECRLLTLSGSGGVGKTRIATRVGLDRSGAHPDGVWFVDLSLLSEPALVPTNVMKAVGIRGSPPQSPTESIGRALGSKNVLLILDNCEHVIESTATFVEEILRKCPFVRILATSRQSLGVEGEVV